MNTFAESPLLFFMDNMPPIVNASKDARKIVELADTGCDASLPVQPEKDFRYSTAYSYKMKSSDWNLHTEDGKYDKSYEERFRIKNKRNTVDVEDYHFNKKNDSANQHRWQRYPPQDDATEDRYKRVGKRSPTREFRTKLKMTSQEAHRWKEDKHICEVVVPNPVCPDYNVNPQSFPKSVNTLTRDRQLEPPPRRSKIGGASLKFVRSDHPKTDLDAKKRETGSNRENEIHMVLDYPENFGTADYRMSNASKVCKDHQRKSNGSTSNDAKNPAGQPSQRYNRFARHGFGNTRTAGSSKSSKSDEPAKDWRDAADSRVRSRTRSPPIDRRKRTRPFQKSCCENTEQSQNRYESELVEAFDGTRNVVRHRQLGKTNSDSSMKMFVDRAVDKDSLSNLLNVATSVEPLTDTINSKVLDVSKEERDQQRNARTTYWDFIPLDDENYVEHKRNIFFEKKRQSLASYNCRPTKNSSRESGRDPGTKAKVDDEEHRDSLNLYSYDDQLAALGTALETTHGTSCPNDPKAAKVPNSGDEQQRCKPRGVGKLLFGYPGRLIGQAKSESNGDREEKKVTNLLDRKGVKASIVERTAARLKRKIGKSRANGVSTAPSQASTTTIDEKFRSELPIRIGKRRRSRNPSAARCRFNAKPCAANEEEKIEGSKELPEDSVDRPNSVRSRTKPKLKPTIPHNRIIIESVEAPESFQQRGDAQTEAEEQSFLKDESTVRSESLEKHDNDYGERDGSKSGCVHAQTTLSMLKLFDGDADDKFKNNAGEKEIDDFNVFYTEDDERRMTKSTNGSFGRKIGQKNGFKKPPPSTGFSCNGIKEICCFHLNDAQNIVCNSYYDKDNRKLDSFRPKKPTVARSRF